MPVVEHVAFIAAPLEHVFACARRPDLPPVLACGGRLLGMKDGSPTPPLLAIGDVRVFQSRLFWFPRRATMRMTEITPSRWIREHRTSGPLRVFQHERYFEAVAGGTRILDMVAFRARYGPVGRFIDFAIVYGRIQRSLVRQCEALRVSAEPAAPSPACPQEP
ncbi:MAG: hypothetical protein K8T90_09875 [Planctomycetes bacterium]|nr:hypothetical protein [Planctomycetota bacterium]